MDETHEGCGDRIEKLELLQTLQELALDELNQSLLSQEALLSNLSKEIKGLQLRMNSLLSAPTIEDQPDS